MLTSSERSRLRGEGNRLRPQVWVGKEGLSDGMLQNLNNALHTHELIKIKLQENCPVDKREVAGRLAEDVGGEVVQIIGSTILLYRPLPEKEA